VAAGGDPRNASGDPFAALFSAGADPELIRLVLRVMNLLELPITLMARLPELQAKAAAEPARAPRPSGAKVKRPSRADLLAVVA
jgi:hypothetical protein